MITEAEILNVETRKKILDEMVDGPENLSRKMEAVRRHEVYRDQNAKWVIFGIMQEGFKKSTVAQMSNRASNISIARKIVDKKAVTYNGGVDRTAGVVGDQESFDQMTDLMCLNESLKKSDRFRELFRNTLIGAIPIPADKRDDGQPLFKIQPRVYAPWEYDVIEDGFDPTKPQIIIIGDFPERSRVVAAGTPISYLQGAQGYRLGTDVALGGTDQKDEIIADQPADKGASPDKRTFIWWSKNYHFTTDRDGKIVPDVNNPGNENPIKMLPFTNVAEDQDGSFWSQSGGDIVEGSVLINKKLTDINYIAFVQGWGQLVITAKEIPKVLAGGPDNALLFEVNAGDNPPQVFFATSDPPIDAWLNAVKTLLGLLLTTNNLSAKSVSADLSTTNNAASGVAILLDSAELISDLKDNQQIFQDVEPELWKIIWAWHALLVDKKSLIDEQMEVKTAVEPENVSLRFQELKPPMSETEKLNDLKLRKDLGLDTLLDLVKRDNPDMSEEDAIKKVEELIADKKKMQDMFGVEANAASQNGLKPGEKPNGDQAGVKTPPKPPGKAPPV